MKNINFGEISAEVELEINPDYITKGFYEYDHIISKLLNTQYFIVIGNKGAGKSIIGEHLRLTSISENETIEGDEHFKFVETVSLGQFPYKSLKKIITGSSEAEAKLPLSWKWLLLISAFKSLSQDLSIEHHQDSEFQNAVDTLKKIGVLPLELHKLTILSSKHTFKTKLPMFEYENSTESSNKGDELHYLHIISYLEKILHKINTKNKHYLIIDGLDEALSTRDIQYESIASLITEARQINKEMRDNSVPFKIIILCRKDLYKRLPGGNKNKLTNAYLLDLNWYQDQIDSNEKEIVKLANFRAQQSGETQDIFSTYFPHEIDDKPCIDYLLENTRYTPRDFLQLLSYISKKVTGNVAKFSEIKSGIKDYSNEYFWPEIEDELDGYIKREEIQEFKKLLIHFNKRTFQLSEIETFTQDYPEYTAISQKLSTIFETLYECGAISNQFISNGHPKYLSRMKDNNDFNRQMNIVLHRGMYKALSMG